LPAVVWGISPMIEKDVKAFWENDASQHLESAYQYGKNPEVRYPMYEIRRDLVLEILDKLPKGRVLDAGCGAGQVLIECLDRGWDAVGIDFAESMVQLAHKFLKDAKYDPGRVKLGNISDLSSCETGSFDAVIILGVSQYFEAKDDERIWSEIHRVLSPQGKVIIDFVNELFDLMTFNRFTVRFIVDQFIRRFFSEEKIPELEARIRALVTHPDKPDTTGIYSTRRDHVTKRTENPLTIAERMRAHRFRLSDLLFYRFHAVPPLLFEQDHELEKVAITHERELTRNWIGNFTASAFIAVLDRD
jgi:SAM-dependent methyltransferase